MAGCGEEPPVTDAGIGHLVDPAGYGSYYGTGEITFLNAASSNASLDAGLTEISFVSSTGEERLVRDLAPGKTLVLVVVRGNTVPICPLCSTQTARLITNYEAFKERGAEVAVVYPIETGDDSRALAGFLSDVKTRLTDASNPVPFPILLDVELKGVDQLGIRKDLSKPATYIVDAEGNVQYAYVGEHVADRPSVPALLAEVDRLKPPTAATLDESSAPSNAVTPGETVTPKPTSADDASKDAAPKTADDPAAKEKPTEDSATE